MNPIRLEMLFVRLKILQEKRKVFLEDHLNFHGFPNLVLVLCVTIFSEGDLILECMVVEKSVEYPEGIFRLLL